jgi:hypothetical protein
VGEDRDVLAELLTSGPVLSDCLSQASEEDQYQRPNSVGMLHPEHVVEEVGPEIVRQFGQLGRQTGRQCRALRSYKMI